MRWRRGTGEEDSCFLFFLFCFVLECLQEASPLYQTLFTNVALVILIYRCEKRGPERLRNMSIHTAEPALKPWLPPSKIDALFTKFTEVEVGMAGDEG